MYNYTLNSYFIFNYNYILIDSTPDEVLEDDVFIPASNKRPSESEGDTSNIIPPSTRPRFMDSDVPDESQFMPPPIARSSMSKSTKSKPPTSKPPKSKPQIPKTTRKTRSQTANESTTTNESLSSDDSISNDTLSALVKKSRDLSHLQKNLLTKSGTRERQTKST